MRVGGNPYTPDTGFGFAGEQNALAAPQAAAPAATPPTRRVLDAVFEWGRFDISAAGTSYAAMPQNPGVAGANIINHGRRMPFPGQIVSVDVSLSDDVGAAGKDYSVQPYLNANDGSGTLAGYAATGIVATVAGGAGTEIEGYDRSGGVSFNEGAWLAVYDKAVAGVGTPSATVLVGVVWDLEA